MGNCIVTIFSLSFCMHNLTRQCVFTIKDVSENDYFNIPDSSFIVWSCGETYIFYLASIIQDIKSKCHIGLNNRLILS